MSIGRKSKKRFFNSDWENVFNKNAGKYIELIIKELAIHSASKGTFESFALKSRKQYPPINEEEIPFQIPGDWQWCRLGELGICKTGTTPPTVDIENFGDYIPFIKPADITLNGLNYNNEGLSIKGLNKGVIIGKGSLLMVCIGGSIGKSFYNTVDVSCNQQINTVTPFEGNNVVFFQTFLQSGYFQKAVWAKASGGTTPIVNRSKWESILIPLPPFDIQDRIVSFLNDLERNNLKEETYFNLDVERIITDSHKTQVKGFEINLELTQQLNLVKKLRQQLLQDAVQGKLVAQDPNDEPASVLLHKIRAEKAQLIKYKKLKKEKELPPIKSEEISNAIPESWVWCRGDNVAMYIDPQPSHRTPPESIDGVPYIAMSDIKKDGSLDFNSARKVSLQTLEEHKNRYTLKNGDFIFGKIGTIGKPVKLPSPYDYTLSANVILIQPSEEIINAEYFFYYLSSPGADRILKDKKSTMSYPVFGMGKARHMLVPLPPLMEQIRIVQKINELMKFVDALEASIKQSQQQNQHLLQQVLREALMQEEV